MNERKKKLKYAKHGATFRLRECVLEAGAARHRVSFLSIFLKTNIRSDELYNTDGILEKDPLVPRAPFAAAIAEKLCFCCARFVFFRLFSFRGAARRRTAPVPSALDTKMGRRYSL